MDEGRTHCLDCVEGMRHLADGSVDCVIADPPFNLRNGGRMFRGGRLERAGDMAWDSVENGPWLREALRVLASPGSIFVFGTHHSIFEVGHLLQRAGVRIVNTIALVKTNGYAVSPRVLYERTTYVVWASPSGRWRFDRDLMRRLHGGKQLDNVWRYTPPVPRLHPTQKGVDVIERILFMATRPGDLVLDPFAGSGTTAEACLRLGRRYLGFETCPEYALAANARVSGLAWAIEHARATAPT